MIKNKKLFIILIAIIIAISCLTLSFFLSSYEYSNVISIDGLHISNCRSRDSVSKGCGIPNSIYTLFKSSLDNKKISDKLNFINETNQELYQKSKNSNTDDPECASVSNVYKHRFINSDINNIYENKNIISIVIYREYIDVCTDQKIINKVESYYYDRKNDRFLSQKELLKIYKINNIGRSIGRNIVHVNREENKNYTYLDATDNYEPIYWIYFDEDGQAYAYYKQNIDNTYYSAKLNYKIKD